MKSFILSGILSLIFFVVVFYPSTVQSQETYQFKELKRLPATSVKAQGKTGTCWVFSILSMLESELLRMEKGEYDLSEMFIVRQAYIDRAELFVRYHGHMNFSPGAQAWDVMNVIREDGMVPQSVMPGFRIEPDRHNHREMDAVLEAYMESIAENKNGKLSPVWDKGYEGILSAYLGSYPEQFEYKNRTWSPDEFRDFLGIDPGKYIPFTSFTNHPWYSPYVFESPDNWSSEEIYNVPLDVLLEIIKESVKQGYTLAWAADVSDPGFRSDKGLAIVPAREWGDMSLEERQKVFEKPVEQAVITPEMRQKEFDNYSTTDDHLMHIVGLAEDQLGNEYFIVKNSWGTESPYGGYLYVSEAYVRLRTTSIMLNVETLPDVIRTKFSF